VEESGRMLAVEVIEAPLKMIGVETGSRQSTIASAPNATVGTRDSIHFLLDAEIF
jgi:hypothetical protein